MDIYWAVGVVIVGLIAIVALMAWIDSWAPPALRVALRLAFLAFLVSGLFEPLREPLWHSILDKLFTAGMVVYFAIHIYTKWGPPSVGGTSRSGREENEARA